jgi:hypothetical protein
MLQGYLGAWLRGERQLDDPELRAFIRRYQRKALVKGRARAVAEIERRQEAIFTGGNPLVRATSLEGSPRT